LQVLPDFRRSYQRFRSPVPVDDHVHKHKTLFQVDQIGYPGPSFSQRWVLTPHGVGKVCSFSSFRSLTPSLPPVVPLSLVSCRLPFAELLDLGATPLLFLVFPKAEELYFPDVTLPPPSLAAFSLYLNDRKASSR